MMNPRPFKSIVIILPFFFHMLMFAQSAFLEEGQGATAISAVIASNKAAFSVAGAIAFSIKGRLDIGLAIARTSYSKIHYSGTAFIPSIEMQIIKGDTQIPLALSAGVSCEAAAYSNDFNPKSEITSSSFSLFGSIYRNVLFGGGVIIQPAYELRYLRSFSRSREVFTVYRYDTSGLSYQSVARIEEADIDSWLHTFGLTFSPKTSHSTQLLVTPAITLAPEITTWGAGLGVIF